MKRSEFLKQVEEGRLLPIYLLLGEEKFFREELLQKALTKLLDEQDRQFNFLRLYASELEPEELIIHLETPSFFGANRVILVDEFHNAKSGLDEALLKGIKTIADGVYLFIASQKLDGRKKTHQELQKRVNVVDCGKIAPNEVAAWIKQLSETAGLKLTTTQIKLIAQRLGTDLLRINTELQKLSVFAGDSGQVTDADLNDLLPAEPEPNIFALIDAIAAKNPRIGLPQLTELLDSGEPELRILATLAKQFRNIAAAIEGRRQGLPHRTLASLLAINPYVAEKSYVQSGQFTIDEMERILNRLLMADYRIKTGQREARLELELAVVDICS